MRLNVSYPQLFPYSNQSLFDLARVRTRFARHFSRLQSLDPLAIHRPAGRHTHTDHAALVVSGQQGEGFAGDGDANDGAELARLTAVGGQRQRQRRDREGGGARVDVRRARGAAAAERLRGGRTDRRLCGAGRLGAAARRDSHAPAGRW